MRVVINFFLLVHFINAEILASIAQVKESQLCVVLYKILQLWNVEQSNLLLIPVSSREDLEPIANDRFAQK